MRHTRLLHPTPHLALQHVRSLAGTTLDPQVVETLARVLQDERLLQRLLQPARGAHVLLAVQDPTARALLEHRVADTGFQVTPVADGLEAIACLQTDPPNLVVADADLPEHDGISLLVKLQRDPKTATVPVVILAHQADATFLNKALKLGAKDVLTRPVDPTVLAQKLRALAPSRADAPTPDAVDQTELALSDVLRMLSLRRATLRVIVDTPGHRTEIYLERGAPVAAFSGPLRGRDALFRAMTPPTGDLSLAPPGAAPERNLFDPLVTFLRMADRPDRDLTRRRRRRQGPAGDEWPSAFDESADMLNPFND